MNKDLKIIKKKYGENMAKLCRSLFPTILQEEGLLSSLLLENFEVNRSLYDDLVSNDLVSKFKNYIYIASGLGMDTCYPDTSKTPKELLDEAGYILYECKSEEEIQYFTKYYKENEQLCTFNGGRLEDCHVFFAVKKDVDSIKREDFPNPQRQDLYGTSVISIQFTKDEYCTLSIKNRYNHTVNEPDATFSNDLDNIIPGLTTAFNNTYGLKENISFEDFEIPDYKKIDNKFYKCNTFGIHNVYYGPNNTIIDNNSVIKDKYPPEQYILMDYFLVDLKTGKISLCDDSIQDSFVDSMKDVNSVKIEKKNGNRILHFTTNNNGKIDIELNKSNSIIGIVNNEIEEIDNNFLSECRNIQQIEMNNVKKVKNNFLYTCESLKEIHMDKVEEFGDRCLCYNESTEELIFPQLKKVGQNFSYMNHKIKRFVAPQLEKNGQYFLTNAFNHRCLQELTISSLNEDPLCKCYQNYYTEQSINERGGKSR